MIPCHASLSSFQENQKNGDKSMIYHMKYHMIPCQVSFSSFQVYKRTEIYHIELWYHAMHHFLPFKDIGRTKIYHMILWYFAIYHCLSYREIERTDINHMIYHMILCQASFSFFQGNLKNGDKYYDTMIRCISQNRPLDSCHPRAAAFTSQTMFLSHLHSSPPYNSLQSILL